MKTLAWLLIGVAATGSAGCISAPSCCQEAHRLYWGIRDSKLVVITSQVPAGRTSQWMTYRYFRSPDEDLIRSNSAALIRLVESADPRGRAWTVSYLAHFGTEECLAKALELLECDSSPEVRGAVGAGLASLCGGSHERGREHETVTVIDAIHDCPRTNGDVVVGRVSLFVTNCDDPAILLPVSATPATLQRIEDAVLNAFVLDDGTYRLRESVFPFPSVQASVRENIVRALECRGEVNSNFVARFQGLSTSPDPEVQRLSLRFIQAVDEERRRRLEAEPAGTSDVPH